MWLSGMTARSVNATLAAADSHQLLRVRRQVTLDGLLVQLTVAEELERILALGIPINLEAQEAVTNRQLRNEADERVHVGDEARQALSDARHVRLHVAAQLTRVARRHPQLVAHGVVEEPRKRQLRDGCRFTQVDLAVVDLNSLFVHHERADETGLIGAGPEVQVEDHCCSAHYLLISGDTPVGEAGYYKLKWLFRVQSPKQA